jgi:hypothetical protein
LIDATPALSTMSTLFTPFDLGALRLHNRIVIAPMCQYSAVDGAASDWHLVHLGHLALSGAGLLVIEATAVEALGRITPGCLGCGTTPPKRRCAARCRWRARTRACPSPSSWRMRGARRPATCRGGAGS